MTLHEAIEQVLQTNGKPMSTNEIAEIINSKQLYIRKDNMPIQATQIAARVGNYPNLFTSDSGKINLAKNDFATLLFQKVRNNLVHNFSEHRISNTIMPFDLLKKSIFELLDKNEDENLVKEPITEYVRNKDFYGAKLDAIYKLCHWYLLQESHSRDNYGILNDGLIGLLAKINWFEKRNNTIITDSYLTNYFLFKILKENSESVFTLEDNSADNYVTSEIKSFNEFLIGIYNNYLVNKPIINYESLKTEIIFPPIGSRSQYSTPIEFAEILNEITTKQKKLDKAMLLVAVGTLTSSRKSHIEARKIIIESNFLDTIVELPSGVVENTGVKMALLLFDFKRNSQDKTLFIDASNLPLIDLFNVAETINNKNIIKEYSIEISPKNIISEYYNLLPARYLYNNATVELREGYEIFSLEQILADKKTGTNLNQRKSNFYSGGEYKLIRNSDLIKNSIYFTPSEDAIGIDADQLLTEKLSLVKGGLAISAINQNIKSNVLPENENFVIGNYIHWLKPIASVVTDEYLAKELLQPYVLKQFNLYASGSSNIPLIRLNDLLKIQVQIPSLEIQRELLFNELRNKDAIQRKTESISDRELDFIKTLKHALKQPTAGLGNDFASLKHFLNDKITSHQTLAVEETIVPIFEDDSPETIVRYSLASTLARMERSLNDIDYILEQAVQLITIVSPNKKEVDLKSILSQIKTEYPKVTIKVSGRITKIIADESQLKIALYNLIDNAIKHGFKELKVNPIIWLEIIKKDTAYIEVSVRNNGKPLPPEFTIDDFLAKGKSSKADVGSGFGGFLIGQIIKNHKGKIELNNNVGNEILPHNVEFVISLPK